ncbi:hypothetical protein MASR2M70_23010 [Bacillota bacterium]
MPLRQWKEIQKMLRAKLNDNHKEIQVNHGWNRQEQAMRKKRRKKYMSDMLS